MVANVDLLCMESWPCRTFACCACETTSRVTLASADLHQSYIQRMPHSSYPPIPTLLVSLVWSMVPFTVSISLIAWNGLAITTHAATEAWLFWAEDRHAVPRSIQGITLGSHVITGNVLMVFRMSKVKSTQRVSGVNSSSSNQTLHVWSKYWRISMPSSYYMHQ